MNSPSNPRKRDIVEIFRAQNEGKANALGNDVHENYKILEDGYGSSQWSGRSKSTVIKIRQEISDDILKIGSIQEQSVPLHSLVSNHAPSEHYDDNITKNKHDNKPTYSQLRSEVQKLRLKLKEKTLYNFDDDKKGEIRKRARSDVSKILQSSV